MKPAEHEQPAPVATPKWCNVHQHHKWCEHNGGVMGPTGYAAPDVQAQIDAAVAREREAAVYDFAAWLTTRKERLVLSSSDDAAPAAKAVQAYLRAHGTKGEA